MLFIFICIQIPGPYVDDIWIVLKHNFGAVFICLFRLELHIKDEYLSTEYIDIHLQSDWMTHEENYIKAVDMSQLLW